MVVIEVGGGRGLGVSFLVNEPFEYTFEAQNKRGTRKCGLNVTIDIKLYFYIVFINMFNKIAYHM